MTENERKGRNWRAKYLQRDEFYHFKENDFWHLTQRVAFNTKLLWIILGGLIAAALVERLV